MSTSPITVHVLDTALGRPAPRLRVILAVLDPAGGWRTLAERLTDPDGRVSDLIDRDALEAPRTYRMTFDTGAYLATTGQPVFYPWVEVAFAVSTENSAAHFHIPLLLSPFGYSTYRGS